jgi:hypothetical protein
MSIKNDTDNSILIESIASATELETDMLEKENSERNKDINRKSLGSTRKYSTLVRSNRAEFSIDNTLYGTIYSYIVEANLPINSSREDLERIQLNLESFLYNQGEILLDSKLNKEMSINPNIIIREVQKSLLSKLNELYILIANLRKEHTYETNPQLTDISFSGPS